MWTVLKIFIEFVKILLLFCFLAARHVGVQLPNQGLNWHHLYWKAEVLATGPEKSCIDVFYLTLTDIELPAVFQKPWKPPCFGPFCYVW